MRSKLNRKNTEPRKDEAGYALVWVLILLIAAAIILVPILLVMTAGLSSSHAHEERMLRFYAVDAGIEDAAYKIQHDDANLPPDADDPPYQYTIIDVNGSQVTVAIENIWILAGLESDSQGTTPHAEWVVVAWDQQLGVYRVDITYGGSGSKKLERIGVWLPHGFEYAGNPHGITEAAPTVGPHKGGTALTWDWASGSGPIFEVPDGETQVTRTQYFDFTPADSSPSGDFAWVRFQSSDIFLCWFTAITSYEVTATAQDDSGDQTTVISNITRSEMAQQAPYPVSIADYSYESQ